MMKTNLLSQRAQDFIVLFNSVWYDDFPFAPSDRAASASDWNHHIRLCIRRTANLGGYLTRFEADRRFDAVVSDTQSNVVANIEWEYLPGVNANKLNEVKKLKSQSNKAEFSVLITWFRSDYKEENWRFVEEKWTCEAPLVVFVLQYEPPNPKDGLQAGSHKRIERLRTLQTWIVSKGIKKPVREQEALPWNVEGSKWKMLSELPRTRGASVN